MTPAKQQPDREAEKAKFLREIKGMNVAQLGEYMRANPPEPPTPEEIAETDRLIKEAWERMTPSQQEAQRKLFRAMGPRMLTKRPEPRGDARR